MLFVLFVVASCPNLCGLGMCAFASWDIKNEEFIFEYEGEVSPSKKPTEGKNYTKPREGSAR